MLTSIYNSKLLGEGPYVKLFDVENDTMQCRLLVLPGRRIHGICLSTTCSAGVTFIALYGQNNIQMVQFTEDGKRLSKLGEMLKFSDWILDVQLLYENPENVTFPDCLAVAMAHNQVTLWNWKDQTTVAQINCEVHCILYSCRFYGSQSDALWCASGTVFNDILLWPLAGREMNATVAARLQGHEGVIFSIQFSKNGDMLCSASDDRSIRLWNITAVLNNKGTKEIGQLPSLVSVLYGHTARVWDAQFVSNYVVSVGEDATCRIWDSTSQRLCLHTFTGHKGRGIWSLAVNETLQIAATGGGDTSIRLWSLKDFSKEAEQSSVSSHLPVTDSVDSLDDFPRLVKLIDVNTAVVFSNIGNIYVCKSDGLNLQDWTCIRQEASYASYSVAALSPNHNKFAVGSLDGRIKIITIDTGDVAKEWQAYDGKVFSLIWDKEETLYSTGPHGDVICWNMASAMKLSISDSLFKCFLPLSKHCWITAVAVLHLETRVSPFDDSMILMCGDRSGSVHLYRVSTTKSHHFTPHQSFHGLHGKHGVSHICTHDDHIYSAGRNGVFIQYEFKDDQLVVIDKKRPIKGMHWIEQIFFTSRSKNVLVSGFHSTDFVLLNWKTGETILKCYCGGAHRAWDFHMNDDFSLATFAFIKGKELHIVQKQLDKRPVLQEPFHGREAVSMCILQEDNETAQAVIATGSEDCDIMLWKFDPLLDHLQPLMSCPGHVSSVRTLSAIPFDQGGSLVLFSGGGRASLKCWYLEVCVSLKVSEAVCHSERSSTCVRAHNVTELNSPLYRHHRKPKQSDESESRVMSLSSFDSACLDCNRTIGDGYIVISGWSDGCIRFYHFSKERKTLTHLMELPFHNHCIMSVTHLVHSLEEERRGWLVVAFTAATDGRIAVWNCQDLLSNGASHFVCSPNESDNGQHDPISVYSAHQSGVNDITVSRHSGLGGWLLVSGGDDNSLYASLLETCLKSTTATLVPIASGSNLDAHHSSITGVRIDHIGYIVSVSVDQTIRRWSVAIHDQVVSSVYGPVKTLRWNLVQSCFTNVADVSAIILLPRGHVGVCGVGIEVIKWQPENCSENIN
ncbi:tRNA (34-2'-O)-methyltransferase regulator WDR6-like isoform X2 [Corticium candelabrum]|uniref:tRNA (34-2'-O)-methyltransferase regulator WDR6-like isoform X2 n=1 Tax=Corticium candelabrum TaxID=121492 RepID=UPI002E259E5B|nr:tRNA (34-2'-O)-methyltransferase regulator WDR6-like isoform X2 [Corticium candelabrum]